MTDHPPPTRRCFAHPWDEIEYLYQKMLHWAYGPNDLRRARQFAPRLLRLLKREDSHEIALLGLSARALMADIAGRYSDAIRYRRREIETIEKLLRIGGPAASDLGSEDVSDRLDLLAIHYWDAGNLRKARETLETSREYCRKHRIPFDAQDVLDAVMREQVAISRNGRNGAAGTHHAQRAKAFST